MPDKCPVCDRVKATERICPPSPNGERCYSGRWESPQSFVDAADADCRSHAVDWRARALAAEGELARSRQWISDANRFLKCCCAPGFDPEWEPGREWVIPDSDAGRYLILRRGIIATGATVEAADADYDRQAKEAPDGR